jgi:hypothetical protein
VVKRTSPESPLGTYQTKRQPSRGQRPVQQDGTIRTSSKAFREYVSAFLRLNEVRIYSHINDAADVGTTSVAGSPHARSRPDHRRKSAESLRFHSGIFRLRDAIDASDKLAPPAKLRR